MNNTFFPEIILGNHEHKMITDIHENAQILSIL